MGEELPMAGKEKAEENVYFFTSPGTGDVPLVVFTLTQPLSCISPMTGHMIFAGSA